MNILKKHFVAFTGLFSFIIYLFTLAPSVIEIDSGELASVQAVLGIAHPTGYPLFSMLGYLFMHLPSPFSKILMANLLASVWCSLGIMIFTLTAKTVLDNLDAFRSSNEKTAGVKSTKSQGKKDKKKSSAHDTINTASVKDKNSVSSDALHDKGRKFISPHTLLNENNKIFSSALGGLVLAFSRTFWAQSTSVEVYSLHIFLITLVIFALIKAYLKTAAPSHAADLPHSGSKNRSNDPAHPGDIKMWILFALALALSFSNHMTTMLILPGVAYLYFEKNRFNSLSYKKILIMLLCFFPLLILLYSYLPVRASQNPVMNWGNPVDMERILRHVSGKQYQVWLFSSMGSAQKQLGYFINNFPTEFAIVSLLFIVLGLLQIYSSARKFFIFIIITFLFTVLYSINYDIVDIDSYFLLAYIALGFVSVFGIYKLLSLFRSKGNYLIPLSITSVLIILEILINFRDINRSGVRIYEDYTKGILKSTAKKSIVLSYQWDYFISASYYFQDVENFRPDVTVIDKELLRRSWYFNQLKRNHPETINKLQPYIDPFVKALTPFERDEKFDPDLLERLYRNIMIHLVTDNIDEHPVYIAPELVENEMAKGEFTLPEGYYLVPDLFLFKVVKTTDYVPAAAPDFQFRVPKNKNQYTENIERFIGSMLVRRALYEMKFDNADKARMYINKIKKDLPDYQVPYDLAQAFN